MCQPRSSSRYLDGLNKILNSLHLVMQHKVIKFYVRGRIVIIVVGVTEQKCMNT